MIASQDSCGLRYLLGPRAGSGWLLGPPRSTCEAACAPQEYDDSFHSAAEPLVTGPSHLFFYHRRTILGPFLLSMLFQGSTWYTEKLSCAKYKHYKCAGREELIGGSCVTRRNDPGYLPRIEPSWAVPRPVAGTTRRPLLGCCRCRRLLRSRRARRPPATGSRPPGGTRGAP